MAAYYNEFDPFAAAWIRELIKVGVIADGEVDERSISDVAPDDLTGFTQCHFFAGVGVWSYALRNAGWPDDKPVWTGSCPCQPFSDAGKGAGFDDERHLWPALFHLISVCSPPDVFGEQVASKDGLAWLDLVHADLEGSGYACGAVDTCAAGFGSPHIRQRLYWVADSIDAGLERHAWHGYEATRRQEPLGSTAKSGTPCGLVNSMRGGTEHGSREGVEAQAETNKGNGHLSRKRLRSGIKSTPSQQKQPGPVNGFWENSDWLFCRDEKWRPVGSGTFPLADVSPDRMGRLRGYGNAIIADQAQAFIESYIEIKQSQI
ncbi:MAG: DNA cytosine methyltransferase [Pseudodesulfovibrio sp.]|nr:DNA cytosine methyltransferase [Pseudodesulfovibrio sp.]